MPSVLPDGPGSGDAPVSHPRVPPPIIPPFDWRLIFPQAAGSPSPSRVNKAGTLKTIVAHGVDPGDFLPNVCGIRRVKGQVIFQATGDLIAANFIVAVAEGEIESFDKVFCAGVEITGLANVSFAFYKGIPAGEHDTYLDTVRTNDGLPNTAYARIYVASPGSNHPWYESLPVSVQSVAQSGSLEFEFEIHGRKLYDSRLDSTNGGTGSHRIATPSTWTFSRDPALFLADLMTNARWKIATPVADVDWASFAAGADICDATVAGAPRFLCDMVIGTQGDVSTHLGQVYLTCNGSLHMKRGKLSLFIDAVNAGAAVLALSTDTNIADLSYEWLSSKDQPTQIAITYANAALNFKEDTIRVPATVSGDLREARFTLEGVTDTAHAHRVGAYLYNQNVGTPLRVTGKVSQAGILLYRGAKVSLTSSDGLSSQAFLVDDAEMLQDIGHSVHLRQYDASIYADTTVDGTVPPIITEVDYFAVGDIASVRQYGAAYPNAFRISWEQPRVMLADVLYSSGAWSSSGLGSADLTKVNDGITNVLAFDWTPAADSTLQLDLGATPADWRIFSSVTYNLLTNVFVNPPMFQYTNNPAGGWSNLSDDYWEPAWVAGEIRGYRVDFSDVSLPTTPQRYWRMRKGSAVTMAMQFTEVQWHPWAAKRVDPLAIKAIKIYAAQQNTSRPTATGAPALILEGTSRFPSTSEPLDLSAFAFNPGDGFEYLNLLIQVVTYGGTSTGRNFYAGIQGRIAQSAVAAFGPVPASGVSTEFLAGDGTFRTPAGGGSGVLTKDVSSTTVTGSATTFTFSSTVSADDMIFADGAIQDEAAGDYTRSGSTVTFAAAPQTVVKRYHT